MRIKIIGEEKEARQNTIATTASGLNNAKNTITNNNNNTIIGTPPKWYNLDQGNQIKLAKEL